MNANRMIGMLGRIFGRRLLNWGIGKGINRLARPGAGRAPALTPEQARTARMAVKKARQAARITRRMGR